MCGNEPRNYKILEEQPEHIYIPITLTELKTEKTEDDILEEEIIDYSEIKSNKITIPDINKDDILE